MEMPGFTAEAALYPARSRYRAVATDGLPVSSGMILPQQGPIEIPIPPGLRCLFDYWDCNNYCSSLPVWHRAQCFSYCFSFYLRCAGPILPPPR